jgi:hypothetical protein
MQLRTLGDILYYMARCVWSLVDEELTEHLVMNTISDARVWLFWLFDTMPEKDVARVLVVMWAIWWARRRAIHDNEYQSPLSTISFVNKYLEELEVAVASNAPRKAGTNSVKPQRKQWIQPEASFMKINVDASVARSVK